MNSVGFAQGTDKFTAQRSLVDVQSQHDEASSTASPLGTSVQTMSSTPFSEHSLPIAPLSTSTIASSHTPTTIQTPSTTDPTKTALDSPPMAPLNTQPLCKLNSFSYIKLTCAHWYQPSSRCTISAPTNPLSDSNTGRPTPFIYSKPTHPNWNRIKEQFIGIPLISRRSPFLSCLPVAPLQDSKREFQASYALPKIALQATLRTSLI
jgi:hypothetical protein